MHKHIPRGSGGNKSSSVNQRLSVQNHQLRQPLSGSAPHDPSLVTKANPAAPNLVERTSSSRNRERLGALHQQHLNLSSELAQILDAATKGSRQQPQPLSGQRNWFSNTQ
jgi:hypothetical protein